MTKLTAVVNAASGLHARPASIFVKTATQFSSTIKVSKDGKEVDGKRLLAVLTLGAKQGEKVTITADGSDEKEAIGALKKLFDDNFGE